MMIGLSFNQAKSGFFDRQSVIDAVDKATRKNLSKFGAFVRTAAKGSIRKRKKPAAAGKPPSSHTGLLKNFIYFSWDASRRSVVVGPAKLNGTRSSNAPESLEYGGQSQVVIVRRKTVGKQVQKKREVKVIQINPHPFMGPAFESTKTKLPGIWQNSVKG